MILINGMKVSEVICLFCLHRWTAARPVDVPLTALECPGCGAHGAAIETGETNTAEGLIRQIDAQQKGEDD